MKILVIFVVFFAAAVNSERCVDYGIDYYGYDITSGFRNINHWIDCAEQCNSHRSCSYWTWNTQTKGCALKSSKAGRRSEPKGISGSYTCLNEC